MSDQLLPTHRPADFQLYARFVATPLALRSSASFPKNDTDFSREYRVNRETLWEWKKKPEFQALVRDHFNSWAKTKTPQVGYSLYQKAKNEGSAQEVKLWYQLYEGFSEKNTTEIGQNTLAALLGANDQFSSASLTQ